jgi:hypothetical protein
MTTFAVKHTFYQDIMEETPPCCADCHRRFLVLRRKAELAFGLPFSLNVVVVPHARATTDPPRRQRREEQPPTRCEEQPPTRCEEQPQREAPTGSHDEYRPVFNAAQQREAPLSRIDEHCPAVDSDAESVSSDTPAQRTDGRSTTNIGRWRLHPDRRRGQQLAGKRRISRCPPGEPSEDLEGRQLWIRGVIKGRYARYIPATIAPVDHPVPRLHRFVLINGETVPVRPHTIYVCD